MATRQAMDKGRLAIDPRGMIFESYRIEGIAPEECRSIFLDWALGLPKEADMAAALSELQAEYAADHPDHPMTALIADGLARTAMPRGRRRNRQR
jgi:hypothetical protein